MHSSVLFYNALDYLLDIQLILVNIKNQLIIQEPKQQHCHQHRRQQHKKKEQQNQHEQQQQRQSLLLNKQQQRRRRLQPWQISIPASY